MPAAPSKPCYVPGCPQYQPCTAHPKIHLGGSADKRITGRRLQAKRQRLFEEYPYCVLCLRHGRVVRAVVRDHIIPLSKGGSDTEANTQALCKRCNDAKGARLFTP